MIVLYLLSATFIVLVLVCFSIRESGKRQDSFQDLIYMMNHNEYEFILLDVRSREEYEKSHCPQARNVPFEELNAYMPTENMFEKMFIYGQSALQARRACEILGDVGYFNVKSFGNYRTIMLYKRYLKEEKLGKHDN